MKSPTTISKTAAANLFAAAVGWISSHPHRLRVLTFHDIDENGGDYSVNRRQFLDCLLALKDEGYRTIRARDLASAWPAILQQERIVLLTFDDGYVSHKDVVAELLLDLGMTATFFILSSLLGSSGVHPALDERGHVFLNADAIRAMDAAGFEIGSHSHTHPLLGIIPPDQASQELRTSKQILEQGLGRPVTSFAFPYGRQRAYTGMTRMLLEENGYQCAFTQEGWRIAATSDLLALPRISIDRFDTLQTFRRKLHGQYEFLSEIRRYARHS